MSEATAHGAPKGELTDPLQDLLVTLPGELADWNEDEIYGALTTGAGGAGGLRALLADRWSHDASSDLSGADVRATAGNTTTIITVNITLDRARPVLLGASARVTNSGSLVGLWGIAITVDGVFDEAMSAGPDQALAPPGNDMRSQLWLPDRIKVLAAGAHVIRLQADRDASGTLDVTGGVTFNGRAYRPTRLVVCY